MQCFRFFSVAAAILSVASCSPVSDIRGPALLVRRVPPAQAFSTRASAAGNQTVTVKSGDTLGAIAKQFGTGICDIAKASGISDPNVIDVGQVLTIPPPTANPDNTSCLPPAAPPATARCVLGGPDRLVIPSDGITADQAAKFLNITLDSFVAANKAAIAAAGGAANGGAGNANATAAAAVKLAGGSTMSVPVCPNSQCTISQGVVQKGDIFDKVAASAGSTTGQILALNPGIDRLNLQVGQTFTLPSSCHNVTASAAVAKGKGA